MGVSAGSLAENAFWTHSSAGFIVSEMRLGMKSGLRPGKALPCEKNQPRSRSMPAPLLAVGRTPP